jgi:hypothetical protein
MEKLSDFFKTIKDRLSNPLIASFLISWLIINWKIVIGVILYKITDLHLDGYVSYLDLVSKNIDTTNIFYHPLIVALIYTFIFPFIRNLIYAFNTWIIAWGNKLNLNLSKKSKVSMTKYLELRETYEGRTKLLEKILDQESDYINENEKIKSEILVLRGEKNDAIQDLHSLKEKLQSSTDSSILNGEWEFLHTGTDKAITNKWYIMNGVVDFIDNSTSEKKAYIKNFFNYENRHISFFISVDMNGGQIYRYYYLDLLANGKILRGREDEKFTVEFRKR